MNEPKGVQLDIFEGVIPEQRAPARLIWSYSRRQILEQCPRRYYYQYYTSAAIRAMKERQGETLRFLKTLSNRHLWAGQVLHLLISQFLLGLRRGKEQRPEGLLNRARAIYRDGPNNSLAYKIDRQSRGLLEFYYKLPNSEQLLTECEERLVVALTNLMGSSTFSPFLRGAFQPDVHTEEPIKLETDYFKARGKIDLAYLEGDRIVIVDWKLGGPGNVDESLQLYFYALWGVEAYQYSPQNIVVSTAHLCDDLVVPVPISANTLRQTRACILQDLEKMQMLDIYGKNADDEAFPPCYLPLVCALCPFQAVCPKESQL